jgi:hypothetical protein
MARSESLWLVTFAVLWVTHAWWEDSMMTHMGMLIPALAVLGGLAAARQGRDRPGLSAWGRRYRASLLLFAVFVLGLWMLPWLLDASLHDAGLELGKWLSLPLAGAALALAWRHLPGLLRAVLQLEAVATLLRLGWLYLAAPQRYCVNYALDDQQRLGYLLIAYGLAYGVALGARVMFARPITEH